ncbi:DNA polymerase III subunit delta [Mesorhizobium sp. J428]|uniref:DNA polymerase III subunit delta n=1 Tax=Mesorhizobium sp. J428 TaxID=2898440 RepID=UPI0021519DC4|nr:DNA polymerase III subunit delta [Mesorhizobium sp. J428]MCR5857247.1 DNA polymerase III subunit delta [Mesorhizobium sp. J428]
MSQKKAHEVEGWIARPDPSVRVVLIYGPDRGLVSERASAFAKKTGLPLDDAFSVIRYDASDLEQDPGRLIDEARMVSMFGGERLIWIRNAGAHKGFSDALKDLLEKPSRDAITLIEAGDLKKAAPLRDMVERADAGMALPCYVDEERAIDAVIDAELARAGKTIAGDARQALRRRLGGDRLATRGEIEKLILYCGEKPVIDIEDVAASSGDVSASSVDQAIDAALAGALPELDLALRRSQESGTHAQAILGAAMRQFQSLEVLRRNVDIGGAQPSAAVAGARPPIFFSRRKLVETALGTWSGASIARALTRLQDSILATRHRPELAGAIVRETMMAIAVESIRSRRRGR